MERKQIEELIEKTLLRDLIESFVQYKVRQVNQIFFDTIMGYRFGIREETLSRWRQNDTFSEEVKNATELVLNQIVDMHKNLLITSQNTVADALNDEGLDLFKKANLALRFLSLMKGKEDIEKKSSDNLTQYVHSRDFDIGI